MAPPLEEGPVGGEPIDGSDAAVVPNALLQKITTSLQHIEGKLDILTTCIDTMANKN